MDLDLDINNYTINDIEKFFKFNSKSKIKNKYSAKDVELREAELREQLLTSGHVDKRLVNNLLSFLTSAKNWLIAAKCPPISAPTIIPKNAILDADPYPARLKPYGSREEELTKREDIHYIITQESEYVPGIMNPIKTRVLSKCLTIDTRFRDNFYTTSSSDFTFQLPIRFHKVVSMQLSSFEIPVSFYGISSSYGNNFLYICVFYYNKTNDGELMSQEKVCIIPDGNYNALDFVDKINGLLSPTNTDGTLVNTNDMVSYVQLYLDLTTTGSGTGKVTIRPSGNRADEIVKMQLDFTRDINGNVDGIDVSSKIGWNLGFTKRYYDGNREYTAETIIEPATIRYIYLAIDDFNHNVNNHFINAFNKSILNSNIIARISIKGNYFSILMENDMSVISEPRKYFGPVDISRLRVRIFDDHGRILEMNGSNYSFSLIFKTMYDI
jgi:hypothetical protein